MTTSIYGGISGADNILTSGTITGGVITGTSGSFAGVLGATVITGTVMSGTSVLTTSTHGATFTQTTAEATITCSGATSVATNLIPAGAQLLGIGTRVTTLVTSGDGGTSFTIGDGTTADLYGTGIAFTAGTVTGSAQYKTPLTPLLPASRSVTLTCTGGTFSAGVVRVAIVYAQSTGPTS